MSKFQVPDVDGNPIVVGQLVEDVDGGDPCWVTEVCPDGVGSYAAYPCVRVGDGVGAYKARDFRVVTDTFRPPEPATRDVKLLVTGLPLEDIDFGSAIRAGVHAELGSDDMRYARVSVEVVEDE